MKIRFFYHSLVSDWNHGNAHFLRGIATELVARGHNVVVYERRDNWSRRNLEADHGQMPLAQFAAAYPSLRGGTYGADEDPAPLVREADLVLVHEWNDQALIRRLGELRRESGFVLLYHDTHHRLVSARDTVLEDNLRGYDGVLAYGESLRQAFLQAGLTRRAWTWHEAADTRVFVPHGDGQYDGDLVWIGNWGDDERAAELHEFLIEPVRALGLRARVHGVRYPDHALQALREAGITYGGWLPNFAAPRVFGRYRVTVHVPRRPYVRELPGIPTIRPFEALACGIPLISAPWDDAEGLFNVGRDFLMVRNGAEMREALHRLLADDDARRTVAAHGLQTIRARHTCAHRADELLNIYREVRDESPTLAPVAAAAKTNTRSRHKVEQPLTVAVSPEVVA